MKNESGWLALFFGGALIVACGADVRLGDLDSAIDERDSDSSATDGASDATSITTNDGKSQADARASDANTSDATTDGSLDANGCPAACKGNPCAFTMCLPLTLAQNQAGPLYLTIDDADVFWTTSGHAGTTADPNPVAKTSKSGGGATIILALDDGSPRGITVDAANVYWNDASEGGAELIWSASKVDGSNPVETGFVAFPANIQGLASTATTLFITSGAAVRAYDKTLTMSPGTEIVHTLVQGEGLAVTSDGTAFFVADFGAAAVGIGDVVGRTNLPVAVADPPSDITFDADYTYFAAGTTVGRISLVDQSIETIATGLTGAAGIAVDANAIYFTTATDVRRVAKGGMSARVLASGLTQGGRLVVDTNYVYYADFGANLIARVPK